MPHVIIQEPPRLRDYYDNYQPWLEQRPNGSVLQTRGAFLRHDQAVVLVEGIAVELGPPVHFFVAIEEKHRRQITVRCFPHPSPPRSPAVKEIIAQVARQVLALGGKVEKTNLEGFH